MNPLVGFVRRVMAFGPPAFRRRYETEIVDTLSSALEAERRRGGILAMSHLGLRSVVDAICTVRRERALAAWPGGKGGAMMDWLSDVRFVLRGWRRAPGFSATIVLTLVLGLGLASAIFAFADGYLFRPSPFPGANQLYFVLDPNNTIQGLLRASDQAALRNSALADFGFVEWSISDRPVSGQLVIDDRRAEIFCYEVSPGFRRTVRLPLIAGRDFAADDHLDGAAVPMWLSHRFWQREFDGDPGVIGRSFRVVALGGRTSTLEIAGILGPEATSFDLNNEPPDAVVPSRGAVGVNPNLLAMPIVRLPEGMSREQGEARIGGVLQAVAPASDGRPRAARLKSVQENQVAGGKPTARVLFAGALLILLLASINLVHLLLTRGVSRAAEIATRAALGASRWRVTRLFLTESLVLAVAGIAGGLLLGSWLAGFIEASIPRLPTRGRNMALVPMLYDWRVVVFASVLGFAVAIGGGLWPARRALRRSLALSSRNAGGVMAAIPARLSRSILASELAVATVVMVGTLFIGLGIWRYLHQPLGFDYDGRFDVIVTRNAGDLVTAEELDTAIGAVRALPDVRAAGPSRLATIRGIEVPGTSLDPKGIVARGANLGYAEVWGVRLRGGRWFESPEHLTSGDAPVAVVDQRFAQLAWGDADALGQEVRVGGVPRKVIGVIEPMRQSLSRESAGQVLVPVAQSYRFASPLVWAPGATLADLRARAHAAIGGVLPGVDVEVRPVTLETLFLRDIGEAQFQAPIVAAFGVLAFVLAGIGIFGLVSYLVEQRTREFGIRLALGARPQDVWRNVIRQSVSPALVGLVIGLGGAWALESVVRSTVFGWSSSGVGAAAVVAVALVAIAILGAMVPARRAMRIDPVVTLRME